MLMQAVWIVLVLGIFVIGSSVILAGNWLAFGRKRDVVVVPVAGANVRRSWMVTLDYGAWIGVNASFGVMVDGGFAWTTEAPIVVPQGSVGAADVVAVERLDEVTVLIRFVVDDDLIRNRVVTVHFNDERHAAEVVHLFGE